MRAAVVIANGNCFVRKTHRNACVGYGAQGHVSSTNGSWAKLSGFESLPPSHSTRLHLAFGGPKARSWQATTGGMVLSERSESKDHESRSTTSTYAHGLLSVSQNVSTF
jgi:hypothetical protein